MAIDLFNEFATDTSAEEAGTWVPYAGTVEFLIARAGNRAYVRMMERKYRQNKSAIDAKGDTADKLAEQLTIEVMAKTILLGAKGDFTWKGKPAEFSEELAKEMLGLREFRRWVAEKADDMSNYKIVKDSEDEKN